VGLMKTSGIVGRRTGGAPALCGTELPALSATPTWGWMRDDWCREDWRHRTEGGRSGCMRLMGDPDADLVWVKWGTQGTDWRVPPVRGPMQWVSPVSDAKTSQNHAVRAKSSKSDMVYKEN
jgi:hypothetical protein